MKELDMFKKIVLAAVVIVIILYAATLVKQHKYLA
jgi:hypothetical protein